MRVLALCAHTDDAELGCGGSLSKFVRQGSDVCYAAFSRASTEPPFTPETVEQEMRRATAILGITPENVKLYDFSVRKLGYARQDILEEMIRLRDAINPDIVFLPCKDDLHQDHTTVHNEGMRAFKYATLLGYEMPVNNLSFQARSFVAVTEEDIAAKIGAVRSYDSQNHRRFMSPEAIRALAITRGTQVGLPLAECFDVIRWVQR